MTMTNDSQTLSERLAQSRMSNTEALRCAVALGDALRRIHSEGQVHGGISPETVVLTGSAAQLLPAGAENAGAVTPYTAPERLEGCEADACTDIFSFGAVVYEMLTGRRAFEGDTAEALSASIVNSTPPPVGHAGLDRVISICLSKDRARRWQRIQQVVMELKLLSASTRRTDSGAMPRTNRVEAGLRASLEQLETRLIARLEHHEKAVSELVRTAEEELSKQKAASLQVVSEVLNAVQTHLADTDAQFTTLEQRATRAEQTLEAARNEIGAVQSVLAGEIETMSETLKAHSVALEAARYGMARTDDLVERVVEALEALQGIVFEQSEERVAMAS